MAKGRVITATTLMRTITTATITTATITTAIITARMRITATRT